MLIRENYVQLLIFKLLQIELFNNISFESFLFSYSRIVSQYIFNMNYNNIIIEYESELNCFEPNATQPSLTVYKHQIVKKSDYYLIIQ